MSNYAKYKREFEKKFHTKYLIEDNPFGHPIEVGEELWHFIESILDQEKKEILNKLRNYREKNHYAKWNDAIKIIENEL